MVEGARLESELGLTLHAGSNPVSSAVNEVSKEDKQCGTLFRDSKLFRDSFGAE